MGRDVGWLTGIDGLLAGSILLGVLTICLCGLYEEVCNDNSTVKA